MSSLKNKSIEIDGKYALLNLAIITSLSLVCRFSNPSDNNCELKKQFSKEIDKTVSLNNESKPIDSVSFKLKHEY